MLDFENFFKEVIEGIRNKLGDGYRVEEKDIEGLNSTVKHSILISRKGDCIYPCISMDEYYQYYKMGLDVGKVIARIIKNIQEDTYIKNGDVFDFTDWDSVKGHLYGRLINTERNQKLLRDVPNREYLDLSLVYYVRVAETVMGEYYAIQIHNEHLLFWGVDENTLCRELVKNMSSADDVAFENMSDILIPFFRMRDPEYVERERNFEMYVLGSKSRVNGAVQMCNRKALQSIAEYVQDDFWILPSSIHEVILVPCRRFKGDIQGLSQIVREVNDTQVAANEILSYHVYCYSKNTGKVVIAA